MKRIYRGLFLGCGALLGASPALAFQFTVTGPGSMVPAGAPAQSGGGGIYDTLMPPGPATSVVMVTEPVQSIDTIELKDFEHSFAGDLQAVLVDPNGTGYLIFLRPGFLNPSNFGTSGDFLPGTYTFVESGGASLPTESDELDIPPGTYDQTFDSGGTTWVDGNHEIYNVPLSQISGPDGPWELRLYDWANGDWGSFSEWTLTGNQPTTTETGTPYCFGDGSGTDCPCLNFGTQGEGCANSTLSGAVLWGEGQASFSNDTVVLHAKHLRPFMPGLFFQGDYAINGGDGVAFGDGLRCAGGNLVRLETVSADINGEAQTSSSISQNPNNAGLMPGDTKDYQYWYRDPVGPCTSGFNLTNGLEISWQL